MIVAAFLKSCFPLSELRLHGEAILTRGIAPGRCIVGGGALLYPECLLGRLQSRSPPNNTKKIKIAQMSALLDVSSQRTRALLISRVEIENLWAVEVRTTFARKVRQERQILPRIT